MKTLIVLTAVIFAVSAFKLPAGKEIWREPIRFEPMGKTEPMADGAWKEYKLKFGKFYDDEAEELKRYKIWKQHLQHILEHNDNPSHSYKKGLNHFHDMTHEEFRKVMGNCYKTPNSTEGSRWLPPSHVEIPDTVDWRTEGYVTPIKNQGQCGSCWAFSSTGSLEGQTFRKTGTLPSLSEQNLIDCTKSYGNEACNGGWMDNSFKYVRDNKGIDSEQGYPYYTRDLGYCYYNAQYNTATDTGYYDITAGDENALKTAVATVGPISVAIDATRPSFMSYRSGIYIEPTCGNQLSNLDHAVLVVGYGTENGVDYWLVKNSWGTTWGEQGYIRMARNRNDQCGIALKGSYPIV